MGYECKIIADSIAQNGKRLTTFQVTFPRFILAEVNTHRQFSRNSASSRAIPVEKQIQRVIDDPFIPEKFPINQKGMQAQEYYPVESEEHRACVRIWLSARDNSVERVKALIGINEYRTRLATISEDGEDLQFTENKPLHLSVHKQIANRLLEPFMWHTAIISATEYSNFFYQRCHPDAQPEFKKLADMMQDVYGNNYPVNKYQGEWHLPYLQEGEQNISLEEQRKICVARCARVSYLTQEGVRDIDKDLELFARLENGNHWSPFEHVATPREYTTSSGNFHGWIQYRKEFPNECR